MIDYLIMLQRGECIEWELVEASAVENAGNSDIVKCPLLGSTMRVVLRFRAPDWEHAKRVFDWRTLHNHRAKNRQEPYEWEEISALMEADEIQGREE